MSNRDNPFIPLDGRYKASFIKNNLHKSYNRFFLALVSWLIGTKYWNRFAADLSEVYRATNRTKSNDSRYPVWQLFRHPVLRLLKPQNCLGSSRILRAWSEWIPMNGKCFRSSGQGKMRNHSRLTRPPWLRPTRTIKTDKGWTNML